MFPKQLIFENENLLSIKLPGKIKVKLVYFAKLQPKHYFFTSQESHGCFFQVEKRENNKVF